MSNKVQGLETRGVESLFLKPNSLTGLVLTFLDSRAIGRVAVCSSKLKERAASPAVWKNVSVTLMLPDTFWTDRSKDEVRDNLALLKRVNDIFLHCCRRDNPPGPYGENLRQKIDKFAKEQHLDFRMPVEDQRQFFLNHTRRVVQAMCQTTEPSAALHEMLMCDGAFPTRLLKMFYACGNRGTPRTLNYIAGLSLYCPKLRTEDLPAGAADVMRTACAEDTDLIHHHNLPMIVDYAGKSDAKFSMDALEFMLKHGELPKTFTPLLAEYRIKPTKRLAEIIGLLIEKGSIPAQLELSMFLRFGPLEYVKFLMEKANCKVAKTDLSLFLYMFFHRVIPQECAIQFTWTDVQSVIDLMLGREKDVRDYHTQDNRYSDNFGKLMLRGAPRGVLEKLIAVGLKPLNDPNPQSNSIALAICAKQSCDRIALIVSLGALPPSNYKELIEQHYADQPQVQEQLLKLFGQTNA